MKKTFFALLIILATNYSCSPRMPSARADETKAFIGTIESFRPVMGRPPKWYCARFTAAADNTEKKEIWILGASGAAPTSVIDFDGKPMDKPGYNHRPQVGKKVEVKYSIVENGRNDAISIRYVPADYVLKPVAPVTESQVFLNSTIQSENTIIGRINCVWPGVPRSMKIKDCKIRITSDNGGKDAYFETKDASITDIDGKLLSCDSSSLRNSKVEVKYSETSGSVYDPYKPAKAILIRYIPESNISSPGPSVISGSESRNNIFVGKVVKGGVTFSVRCPYRFVIVTDNGETKDI